MVDCLIIDGEEKARANLKALLLKYGKNLNILGEAGSVEEGIRKIESLQPELLFLDIELRDGTGFDVLRRSTFFKGEVIFITAYDRYGLDAIRFSAVDYVLKPIDSVDLYRAIEKASKSIALRSENIRLQNMLQNFNHIYKRQRIALPFVDGLEFVEVDSIVRLEAEGSYTKFIIANRDSLLVSGSLKDYVELLEPYSFIRTHQSHLVNTSQIRSMKTSDGGYLVLLNGDNVPISRLRKREVALALR